MSKFCWKDTSRGGVSGSSGPRPPRRQKEAETALLLALLGEGKVCTYSVQEGDDPLSSDTRLAGGCHHSAGGRQ